MSTFEVAVMLKDGNHAKIHTVSTDYYHTCLNHEHGFTRITNSSGTRIHYASDMILWIQVTKESRT